MLRAAGLFVTVLSSTERLAPVFGHEMYVSMIPNGANVPGVDALGHLNPEGDGAVNDFGQDFADAFYVWTTELCQQDSDGDGQTNGQELGDPCCEWDLLATNASWVEGISHPGDANDTSDPSLWTKIECPTLTSTATSTSSDSAPADLTSSGSASSSSDTSGAETYHITMIASAISAALTIVLIA